MSKESTLARTHYVLRSLHLEGSAFAWQNAFPLISLLCLPAIALTLLVPLHFGQATMAVLATIGAVSVGFGAFQQPLFFRGSPMLTTALGIAISAAAGSATGNYPLTFTVTAMAWAFIYGLSDELGPTAAYIGLQCCVFLVVFSSLPGTPKEALLRGAIVLGGGLLQTVMILLAWKLFPGTFAPIAPPSRVPLHMFYRRVFHRRSRSLHFAVRLGITVCIAVAASHLLHFHNRYWVPMTALIIVKPQLKDTVLRSASRMMGTIAGAGLATALTVLLKPTTTTLVVLVLICVAIFYTMLSVNYAVYAVALTAYVAFVLAIERMPEQQTVMRRVIATALGGAIGFAVHIATGWIKHEAPQAFIPD